MTSWCIHHMLSGSFVSGFQPGIRPHLNCHKMHQSSCEMTKRNPFKNLSRIFVCVCVLFLLWTIFCEVLRNLGAVQCDNVNFLPRVLVWQTQLVVVSCWLPVHWRRVHHDRPEPPDGGGAGGNTDGAEPGSWAEEVWRGESQVEICLSFSPVLSKEKSNHFTWAEMFGSVLLKLSCYSANVILLIK